MKFRFLLASLLLTNTLSSQTLPDDVRLQIDERLCTEAQRQRLSIGKGHVDSVYQDKRSLQLFCNDNVAYLSFREDNVRKLYADIQALLPQESSKKKLQIFANGRLIEELIPNATRPRRVKQKTWAPRATAPLVTPDYRPYDLGAGLRDRHIALWQSHGLYFEQKLNRWEWQRARTFQTVEDLYTQGYVLPFLVPMLENAGANVLLPRERDCQRHELILDNDGMLQAEGTYAETTGRENWSNGDEAGFAHHKAVYSGWDNPFRDGTFRQARTIKKGPESQVTWTPSIPERGEYAVYVSYHTLPNSTTDALYTVHHMGGSTAFHVNQQMGGGTWIYLGTFLFDQGQHPQGCVTLTNRSSASGVVTADAVKIGGGMGNIARSIDPGNNPTFTPDEQLSGYPRFTEGARYWLQWAGAPDSIYSDSHGLDDYVDDYKCRGRWVNWMAGGSSALPDREGLHIPFDLSMAFHSDAGVTRNDTIIGTLMIYETETEGRDTYANGASRYLAQELADLVQSQIVDDVRALHAPEWHRRGRWNASYYEARVPEVPAILLELLSHQNFADMRYGLDPRFRFTVSRAIYKGMLRFIASQHGTPYVVQPLPIDHFSAQLSGNDSICLRWQPVMDPLEPTASPSQYMLYTRCDDGGWNQGVLLSDTCCTVPVERGHIYSWKVAAINAGGRSFDSEILSAGLSPKDEYWNKPVLVVNGFDRISAPADFDVTEADGTQMAGFLDCQDHGVPYLRDISYIGSQKEFRRHVPWMDDDASGFGDSYADQEDKVVAGNTFDYPFVHGKALMKLGQSFVSCSNEAVESGHVHLADYPMVDLILGKQCKTKMAHGKHGTLQFAAFTPGLQQALTEYLQQSHGRLFASGAYVATDLWKLPSEVMDDDKHFATDVLHIKWRANQAVTGGGLKSAQSALSQTGQHFSYCDKLSAHCYIVESPDALEPADDESHTVLRYEQNNLSAAVAHHSATSATYIMGVPFETIPQAEGVELLRTILDTLK